MGLKKKLRKELKLVHYALTINNPYINREHYTGQKQLIEKLLKIEQEPERITIKGFSAKW